MELILRKEVLVNKTLCRVFAVTAFSLLMLLGSFVRIPLLFSPVPITLQTLFVLLSCALMGARLGLFAQLVYIFAGVSLGALSLWGVTGGYFLGFILGGAFCAFALKSKAASLPYIIAVFCLSDMIILACGTIWLSIFFRQPLTASLMMGFIPFIPGDILKVMVGVSLYRRYSLRAKEILSN
jgi:biotin transport system substrate-specific component